MRHGDFAALSGIALGATTAAVLTVALARILPLEPATGWHRPSGLGPHAPDPR